MASATPSLRSLAFVTYRRALKAGAIHFSETEVHNLSHDGINYQIRYAPNLLRKPIVKPTSDHPAPPRSNPFLPPDAALYVSPILATHYLVLNKFPVHAGHCVLATNDFHHQNHPLTVSDFSAVLAVLREWDAVPAGDSEEGDEARRQNCLYGFFNSGANSGASQPHRHVQFLPLALDELSSLWPTQMFATDATLESETGVAVGTVADVDVRWQNRVSYKHYFVRIPPSCSSEHLYRLYTTLLTLSAHTLSHPTLPTSTIVQEVDTLLQNDRDTSSRWPADAPVEFSYNLAFSGDWLGILPRTHETVYVLPPETDSGVVLDGVVIHCPGLNLNGTVLAGMMLVRTRVEMDAVLADVGVVSRALAGIGVPQGIVRGPSL
ncbi:bifunctional AP-4-A phosphorylase/ADP sulfurylase [Orbilia brochopaga]|uniref:Bifunctional AP-4-A phosphorylase/ADP sulfurylase n=1 Tax=Orbilia brochopaga TaxID=3140254 RepID=A0AAV9UM91_9PEZI